MDAGAKLVGEILHSGDQFVVPFFQRQYSWKKEHWAKLWSDIVNLLDEPQSARQHFEGSPGDQAGYDALCHAVTEWFQVQITPLRFARMD